MALTKEKLKELIAAGDLDLRMKTFTNSNQINSSDYIWNVFWGMPDNSILYHQITTTDPLYLRTSNKFPTGYGLLIITKLNASRYTVEIKRAGAQQAYGHEYFMATLNTSDTPSINWFQYSGTAI